MTTARYDSKEAGKEECPHERDEVLIVSFADAGPNPRTMMIKPLYAATTRSAMNCTRRSIDKAASTIFNFS